MPAHSTPLGDVFVSTEVADLVDADDIDAVIDHLRMGGGECWKCREVIHVSDDVSLIAHFTPSAARLGFAHFQCIPPQLVDDRRSRRAALAMRRYLAERSTHVQAFVMLRTDLAPHGLLVVSPETGVRARYDNGDPATPWLGLLSAEGFMPSALDPSSACPDLLPGWELYLGDTDVRCGQKDQALYEGALEMPAPWREIVKVERECVVLVAGIGVCSQELGSATGDSLALLASRGLVLAGKVTVVSSLQKAPSESPGPGVS